MNKSRLEAFSDGVIAIIITIVVLLIDLPDGDDWGALSKMLPLFFCYIVSFVLIGMRWANHHHLFQIAQSVNGKIIWANLFYLFSLSLFPVVTGWAAKTSLAPVPTTLFAILNLVESLAYILLQHTVISSHDCVMVKNVVSESKKEAVTIALELAALGVSFVEPIRYGTYVLLLLMSCLWIIPDLRMKKIYFSTQENTQEEPCPTDDQAEQTKTQEDQKDNQ